MSAQGSHYAWKCSENMWEATEAMMVLHWWLDLVILKDCSNFWDSDLLFLHVLVDAVCVTLLTEGKAEQCTEHGLLVSCFPFAVISCLI